ncbi:MAG: hypothetical protein IJE01_01705 [Clostridia bacterium]|jgi:hypothetical protein|nr:hypothetical protein [Clostridia bacterium]
MPKVLRPPKIEMILTVYGKYTELGNPEIKELFENNISSSTIGRLKRLARQQMIEDGAQVFDQNSVDIDSAYKAWGFDVDKLQKRLAKIQKLNLV